MVSLELFDPYTEGTGEKKERVKTFLISILRIKYKFLAWNELFQIACNY